jgi:hypothetical protein
VGQDNPPIYPTASQYSVVVVPSDTRHKASVRPELKQRYWSVEGVDSDSLHERDLTASY